MNAPQLSFNAAAPQHAASGPHAWLFGRGPTWRAFSLLTLLMLFDFADRMIIAALLPAIKAEWHISDAQAGLLNSVLTLGMIVFAFPTSLVIDRWSRVKTASLMGAIWSIASALGGLAGSFGQLASARAAVGLGEAGYAPAAYSWIAAAFPQRRRQFAMGLFTAGAPIGMALGVAAGGYIATHYGWRHAFGVVALPGLVVAALLFKARDYHHADVSVSSTQTPADWRRAILRTPSLLAAYVHTAMGMLQWVPVFYFLPTYFNRLAGLPVQRASLLTGGLMLLPVLGSPLGGWIMDQLSARYVRSKIGFAAITGGISTVLYLAAFSLALSWQQQYALMVLATLIGSTGSTAALSMTQELVHPGARAFSGTCAVVSAAVLGSLPGPFLTGLASDHFGLGVALTGVTGIAGALALASLYVAWRHYPADLSRNAGLGVIALSTGPDIAPPAGANIAPAA
ncbi:MFS transporter [Amantichitinum ursilacus]|uniref:Putative sulfoacetate transporter SauU n=1 Tax=Amantichitinum ursilacus TaxID=857265 RepID=A0A0N0XKR7_9NEIS|nr:MFS transporter [Amantichitinum ursilacus]KPC55007.1 putative sulfoacetate transporter SauU [Amantichitinum ursilacus]